MHYLPCKVNGVLSILRYYIKISYVEVIMRRMLLAVGHAV